MLCGEGEGGRGKRGFLTGRGFFFLFLAGMLRGLGGWLFGVLFVRGQDGRILDLIGALDVRGCNTLVGFLG